MRKENRLNPYLVLIVVAVAWSSFVIYLMIGLLPVEIIVLVVMVMALALMAGLSVPQ